MQSKPTTLRRDFGKLLTHSHEDDSKSDYNVLTLPTDWLEKRLPGADTCPFIAQDDSSAGF